MSNRVDFRRKSGYQREEELNRVDRQAEGEIQPDGEEIDPELRKYEARRKITRMVIVRLIMCAMLIWTVIRFAMPIGMRILLIVVVLMIIGTMVPVLATLKTTLKYEDE